MVEDAKAIGKHVILSDIPVHREQATENVTFFNPESTSALKNILEEKRITPAVDISSPNYQISSCNLQRIL